MPEALSRNLADTPQLPARVLHNHSVQQNIGQVKNDISYQSFAGKKAREHFEAVIKQGTAEEQDVLGNEYLHGTAGLTQDMAKAFKLFTIAAARGLPIAGHNLGHCYFNGFGVAQDMSKAFELFDALDKQGVAAKETQFYLGLCYLRGNGVRKNCLEALHYFRNAADNGDVEGQLLMCRMLYKGIIVSKDDILANSYFERAKRILGSGPAARTKFNECKLHTLFVQPDVTKNCAGEQCCICAGGRPPFRQGDLISILPCKHYFCQDCLARWFEEKRTCPLCRRVVQMQQVVAGTAV